MKISLETVIKEGYDPDYRLVMTSDTGNVSVIDIAPEEFVDISHNFDLSVSHITEHHEYEV